MTRPWIRPTALILLLALGVQLTACGIPPERFHVHDGEPPDCDPPLAEGDLVLVKLRDGTRLELDEVQSWDRLSLTLSDTTLSWSEVEELKRQVDVYKAGEAGGETISWITVLIGIHVLVGLILLGRYIGGIERT